MLKGLCWAGTLFFLLIVLSSAATSQMFYATGESSQQLDLVNFSAGTVTDIYDIGSRPDSLLVNTQGQILYTVSPLGTLQMYDPKTNTDTVLAKFGQGNPRDMVFDPGGNTILISLSATAQLARYDLKSGAVTIFPQKLQQLGSALDGLAYDPAGNLYAVVSHNTICQIDPNTGAVLQTLVLEPHSGTNGGDGIVYDTFTKNLWVAHNSTSGDGLIEIPLTQSNPPVLGAPILLQTGNFHVPDGVISDGKGNLYIGEGLQFLTEYNIPGDTVVNRVKVPGIDSLAFAPANFTATLTPASVVVLVGETAAYTLNVTTADNSSPTLQVSCSGLPSAAACGVPATVGVGQAQFSVQSQSLTIGNYPFTISVTDGIVIQKLSAQLAVGDFSATLGSNSSTVGVGQSGTVSAVVTGQNGFSDPVTLSCTSPSGATCGFSPSTVNASATGTASTLTISVASRPASANFVRSFRWLGAITGATFPLILVVPAAFKRGARPYRWLCLSILLLSVCLGASCGGSSGSSPGGGGGGGPAGPTTFTVAVQATAHSTTKSIGNVTVTVP